MAMDVTTFLTWASEPHLEARHQTGLKGYYVSDYINYFGLFEYEKIMVKD